MDCFFKLVHRERIRDFLDGEMTFLVKLTWRERTRQPRLAKEGHPVSVAHVDEEGDELAKRTVAKMVRNILAEPPLNRENTNLGRVAATLGQSSIRLPEAHASQCPRPIGREQ